MITSTRGLADGPVRARTRIRQPGQRPVRGFARFAATSPLLCFGPSLSRLSNVAEDTARPDERSISRLALQNPSRSSTRAGRLLVEVDGSVELPGATLNHVARTQASVSRAVFTVQDGDLPLFECRTAPRRPPRGPITNLPYPLRARTHRLLGFPRAGGNASAGLPVHQERYADAPIHGLECGHNLIANLRNSGVDGRRLRVRGR